MTTKEIQERAIKGIPIYKNGSKAIPKGEPVIQLSALDTLISSTIKADREGLVKHLEGIKNSFLARCEHEDARISEYIKDETVYHIDSVINLIKNNGKEKQ